MEDSEIIKMIKKLDPFQEKELYEYFNDISPLMIRTLFPAIRALRPVEN